MVDEIGTSRDRLERAKQNTLVETNAQAIAETLRQLRAAPEIHRRRWIWELIQNAADARDAEKKTNKIQIQVTGDAVVFKHDGAAFDEEELSHLIYHGSTKQADPTKRGKFGSGFITIHLVSEIVEINGVLKQGSTPSLSFRFNLNRSGTAAPEIQAAMEAAWGECLASMAPGRQADTFSTSFTCALGEHARTAVTAGIAELERAAPYVLALVEELSEIELLSERGTVRWQKASSERSGDVSYIDVAREAAGATTTNRLVVVGDHSSAAALVVLLEHGTPTGIAVDPDLPRLFYPLPLVGTESLHLPFAVASGKFEPTEPRNGILAGSNVEESAPTAANWQLLSKLPELYATLVQEGVRKVWSNPYVLAALKPVPSKDWLDEKRFNDGLLRKLVEYLRAEDGPQLVDTIDGPRAGFAQALVPIGEKAISVHALASEVKPLRPRLPTSTLVAPLNDVLVGWAGLLGQDREQLREALTAESLAREVRTRCSDLEGLKALLESNSPDERPLSWLNELMEQIQEQRLETLLKACAILPDQHGKLRSIGDLRLDGGIDDELKTICADLGDDVRSELLDNRITGKAKSLFQAAKGRVLTNDECLERALKKAGEHIREKRNAYVAATARLLRWLIAQGRSEKIDGYPVWAADGTASLRKGSAMLLPAPLWDDAARPFTDVFDASRRLHDDYRTVLDDTHWATLEVLGFVRRGLFTREVVETIEPIHTEDALSEEKEHKSTPAVDVAQILYLKGEEGILADLRKSKPKARRFLEFLLRYVVNAERSWMDGVTTKCSCGLTHTLRSGWLTSVRHNAWVPAGKGRGESPAAANIASLLDDELKQHILSDGDSARFLLKLDIGLADLLRVGVPESKRFQLDQLSAKIYDSEDATIESVETVLDDPSIRDLVLEKKREKETVERNQNVGKLIEDLLRKELEADGVKVRRRPVGSDFEVESDFVDGGQEQVLDVGRYILEVKATSTAFVRMTLRQGIESCKVEHAHRYALCVVPLTQNPMDEAAVRANARFVVGIGPHLKDKVKAAGELKTLEQTISPSSAGAVEIDLVQSQVKLRIASSLWQDGRTFEQFVELLKARKAEERPQDLTNAAPLP